MVDVVQNMVIKNVQEINVALLMDIVVVKKKEITFFLRIFVQLFVIMVKVILDIRDVN